MSDIPTDAYREILRRLPVDCLCQMRSVCKSWRDIIDDPEFMKLHMYHGTGNNWIIMFREVKGTSNVFLLPLKQLVCPKSSLPDEWVYTTNTRAPVIRGVARIKDKFPYPTCNGLILITTDRKNFAWMIWNPFTGQTLELPFCDELRGYNCWKVHRGFGYVEATDDYKVVIIVNPHTYIYSVNSGAWRRVQDFPKVYRIEGYKGASANGVLHWIVTQTDNLAVQDSREYCIAALDLNKEAYSKIPLPSDADAEPYSWRLEELDGSLVLFSHWNGRFVVWMMDYYNGSDDRSWIKMMSVKLEPSYSDKVIIPVAYMKAKNWILLYVTDYLAWYDLGKPSFSKISIHVKPDEHKHHLLGSEFCFRPSLFQVIPASLICPKGDGISSERKRKRAAKKFGLKVYVAPQ